MTISGGIKFFEPNLADSKNGAEIQSATSGSASAPFILDRNKYTVWRSVGSNDAIIENVIIDLNSVTAMNRIFIVGHNFKRFKLFYVNAPHTSWINFTGSNVVGINGVANPSGISETTYDKNTAYYEFDTVSTDWIRIKVWRTQTADEEKFLNSFVATTELGTLAGFPMIKSVTKDKNSRKSKLLNGRSLITKSLETMRFTVDFKNYPAPTPYEADIDLVYELFDRDKNFLTWLCGGRDGNPYFKYQLRGFRIEDVIEMQVVNVFKDSYKDNYYNGTVNLQLKLEEAG